MRPFSLSVAAACLLMMVSSPTAAETVIVHVYNFDFSVNPAGQAVVDPTIRVGDTIRWVFDAGVHTTTSVAGIAESWNSGLKAAGQVFEHTFTHEGVFHYYCEPHGDDNGNGTASGMAGTITVLPAGSVLTNLTLNPTTVTGGNSSTGTVTLSSGAPPGGAVVNLSSSDVMVATVPATVTVLAGATTANFTVHTSAVTTSTNVTISASYEGVTKEAALTVHPALTISSLTVEPAAVAGGASSTGTVTLTSAPSANTNVALSSNNAAASVPASVTVLAGSTSATFPVQTVAVTSTQTPTLSATLGGVTRQATLTVHPPIKKLTLSPATAPGGCKKVTGKVVLNGKASSALVIDLTENHPDASLSQTSITIPAGATSKTFTLDTQAVTTTRSGSVTATCLGVSKSATLKVRPIAVASVALTPNPVVGPAEVAGTVTLDCAAAPGDIVVVLSSSQVSVAEVAVSQITIPAGQKSATFTVNAKDVSVQSTATIRAKANGITKSKRLTVKP